jgi:hypothetical protein
LDFDFPNENVLLVEEEKKDRLVDNVFWWVSKCIW